MLDLVLSLGGTIAIFVAIVFVVGAFFIVKCVSMYNKSEKDRKYDAMLEKPLKKFDDEADELAKKYEIDK